MFELVDPCKILHPWLNQCLNLDNAPTRPIFIVLVVIPYITCYTILLNFRTMNIYRRLLY